MTGTDGKEYDNTEKIIKCVHEYNVTGDMTYMWECRPELEHCIKSLILKRLKGGWRMWGKDEWEYTETIVEMITDNWMINIKKRRDKGNPLEMKSPITYARWQILSYYPTDDAIWRRVVSDYEIEKPMDDEA